MTTSFLPALRKASLLLLCCALPPLPVMLLAAAPATVVYTGNLPSASGAGRKVELRLASNGAMTWLTDFRNNRAPVIDEGRWNATTIEDIDLVIERRDGKRVGPYALRLVRQGETLRTTAESAAEFGSLGLTLTRTRSAPPPSVQSTPVGGTASPAGGVWQWGGLISAAEKITVDNPERYTLELQTGGKALLRADCNRGTATWNSDGRAIGIKPGALTKAKCPAGSLDGRYLKALELAAGHRIRAGRLFLDLPGEGGSMMFLRPGAAR